MYSISGNVWSTYSYKPTSYFNVGASAAYDPETNHVYLSLWDGQRYIYRLKLETGELEPFARVPTFYVRECRRLALVKIDGHKFLYIFRGYEYYPWAVWRIPVYY